MVVICARACANVTPGASRPMSKSQLVVRSSRMSSCGSSDDCIMSGSHMSGRCPTTSPVNDSGATPMIVIGTPLSVIVEPIADT